MQKAERKELRQRLLLHRRRVDPTQYDIHASRFGMEHDYSVADKEWCIVESPFQYISRASG